MKIYLLMLESCSIGNEEEQLISAHSTPPKLPEGWQKDCGCCWGKYFIREMEVQEGDIV